MREIPKEALMSCQLGFYPLGEADYLHSIEEVLSIIQGAGLQYTIGEMSTTLVGPSGDLFALLRRIGEEMDAKGCKFTMAVTVSNVCGVG